MEVKYIDFRRPRPSKSGKTKIWKVESYEEEVLGEISWFGRWRRYAFQPGPFTIFEYDCLRKIADFCENETKKLRRKWQRNRKRTGK